MNVRFMVPGMAIYAEMAVFFVWIGIGSILARRWARALMLIVSWLWLVCGIAGMAGMVVFLPGMLRNMPPGLGPAETIVVTVIGASMGCAYILLPGAFLLFCQSRHVRATCEWKDPQVRWTDRCPLPVLALAVLFAYGASCMVWMPFYGFTFPLFGAIVDGAAGAITTAVIFALCLYLAWGMYKLKIHAWWTAVVLVVIGAISAAVTAASGVDLVELYRRMGFPQQQIDMIKRSGMVDMMNMSWWMGVPAAIVFLGYLFWVRRYFRNSQPPDASAA